MKALKLLSHCFVPTFSLALLLSLAIGCGGSSSSSGGGGNPPQNPPTNPPTNPNAGQWTWMGGSNTVGTFNKGPAGVYGTQGTPDAANIPGGRAGAAVWKDKSGNIWVFGGDGIDSAGNLGSLNDLWEFNAATKQWTWIDGGTTTVNHGQPGVYGTKGVAAATNIPGGRTGAAAWTDANGNLWLFGGDGFDSQDKEGYLNDLWEFDISQKEWIWVGGGDTATAVQGGGQTGTYGTLGVASTSNWPGGRTNPTYWTDSSGNLWLFGGYGFDGNSSGVDDGDLNDLWEFNLSAKTWTWVSGSNSVQTGIIPGVYGTQGVPSAQNTPGGRENANGWTDSTGNFWLFGGYGAGSSGGEGELNDLWEFNVSSQQWVWVSGPDTPQQTATNPPTKFPLRGTAGVYGTKGTASAANVPGSRQDFATWTDSSGNLWLFGGEGFDSASSYGYLNDLWKFDPSAKTWTWMGGSDTETPTTVQYAHPYTSGVYGTMGTPDPANVPGSRAAPMPWIDADGNLWLFGGYGADSTGTEGFLNDLWEYTP